MPCSRNFDRPTVVAVLSGWICFFVADCKRCFYLPDFRLFWTARLQRPIKNAVEFGNATYTSYEKTDPYGTGVEIVIIG